MVQQVHAALMEYKVQFDHRDSV